MTATDRSVSRRHFLRLAAGLTVVGPVSLIAACTAAAPTAAPTTAPAAAPTTAPAAKPTTAPAAAPTTAPTTAPAAAPTTAPVAKPTTAPAAATVAPTAAPAPTVAPAAATKQFAGKEVTFLTASHHSWVKDAGLLDDFQQKTGIKVNWTDAGFYDIKPKYATILAAQDQSVDLFYTWAALSAEFGRGLFLDITDKVDKATASDIVPASLDAFRFQGKLYGLPIGIGMVLFMWRKDIFQAKGLDPEKPPENWAALLAAADKVNAPPVYAIEWPVGEANFSFFNFITLLNSSGVKMYNDDYTKVTFNTPEGLLAMQAFYDLTVPRKVVDPSSYALSTSEDMAKNFQTGKMAMVINFPAFYNDAQDPAKSQIVGKVGLSIVPGVKLRSGSASGDEGYAVSRFAKEPEAALEWLKYYTSKDAQILIVKNGKTPGRKSVLSDSSIVGKDATVPVILQQGEYPASRYGAPFYFDVAKVFDVVVHQMLDGKVDPKGALDQAEKDAQAIVDRYWQS